MRLRGAKSKVHSYWEVKQGFEPRESHPRAQSHQHLFVLLFPYEWDLPSGKICRTGVRISSTKGPGVFLWLPNKSNWHRSYSSRFPYSRRPAKTLPHYLTSHWHTAMRSQITEVMLSWFPNRWRLANNIFFHSTLSPTPKISKAGRSKM